MKYAIYGAGSLGIVLAAYLSKAGEKFTLIDREKNNVDALKESGAKVVGTANFSARVNAKLDTEIKEKFDLVFLVTKQINNVSIVKKVQGFLTEKGAICTLQNGLPEEDVASVLGKERTFGCAVGWGATRHQYGVSELTSENKRECLAFSVGSYSDGGDEMLSQIASILGKMGEVKIEKNFIGARWSKLLINSAFSGMSTVCGDTFGAVAKFKPSRKIIQRIIKECIDVAAAANIKIEPVQGKDIVKLLDYHSGLKRAFGLFIIPLAIKKHKNLKASMLQDIEKKIPCEIDSINGVVCNFGKRVNVKTPFNDMVTQVVKDIEAGKLRPSYDNVKFFDKLF